MSMQSTWNKNDNLTRMGITILILLVHLALLRSTPIHIWPELSFLPWLVGHGLLPYRDFFDHHGFLLSYILAPLAGEKTFGLLNVFFVSIQITNTFLVLHILKRGHRGVTFLFFGILFTVMTVFLTENLLWYESVITTIYLLIYIVLTARSVPYRSVMLGVLIALSSWIKPPAAIILLPVFVFYPNVTIALVVFISWIMVGGMYWLSGGWQMLVRDLFVFNRYLLSHYQGMPITDKPFILITLAAAGTALVSLQRQAQKREALLALSVALVSLIFLRLSWGKEHLVPTLTFVFLFIARSFAGTSGFARWGSSAIVIAYLLFIGVKLPTRLTTLARQRIPLHQNVHTLKMLAAMSVPAFAGQTFYVLGDAVELYQFRDQLPPTRYPVKFPLLESFEPEFERGIIEELVSHNVTLVIEPLPTSPNYEPLTTLRSFVTSHFTLTVDTPSYRIYTRPPS